MPTHLTLDAQGSTDEATSALSMATALLMHGFPEDIADTSDRNARRAMRALDTLHHFGTLVGGNATEPIETQLTDLLADLMHLVDLLREEDEEIHFDGLVERAHGHHTAERAGEL